MSYKIGFDFGERERKGEVAVQTVRESETVQVKKSLVKVYFDERNSAYSYYNDAFDLKPGDYVWVDGKLEGIRGRVVEINYNFKIKLSDYKRVIGVVDTDIGGKFKTVGPYFAADGARSYFDAVKSWFIPPESEPGEVIVGNDETCFDIDDLSGIKISNEEADKGIEYFGENKVAFIEIINGKGRAIIEGYKPHLAEFEYSDGEIKNLICDCYTIGACRHGFAAMLTLKEIIKHAETYYPEMNIRRDGFAAIRKADFFRFVIDANDAGEFVFESRR